MGEQVGIRFQGQVDGPVWIRLRQAIVGNWLTSYDPLALDGLGSATFSPNPLEALRFKDFDAAKAFWYQEGKPGERPLTQCHIEIDALP